ncbi:MAG: phosphorylase [Methylococcaceae bacterium]
MITGLVVALPEEISTLTAKQVAKGECFSITEELLLVNSGTGAANARLAAQKLIGLGAKRLISWGCAAGLSPLLKPGDLSLPKRLLNQNNLVLETDPNWHEYTQKQFGNNSSVHTGDLLDSQSIVSLSTVKQALHYQTNAQVLDMESFAVAGIAQDHNLPFLAIRAIADPVSMNLPRAVSYSVNSEGQVVLFKLLSFLALHPNELPGLIKLGLHFSKAQKTLKNTAKKLHLIAH